MPVHEQQKSKQAMVLFQCVLMIFFFLEWHFGWFQIQVLRKTISRSTPSLDIHMNITQ